MEIDRVPMQASLAELVERVSEEIIQTVCLRVQTAETVYHWHYVDSGKWVNAIG